VREIWRAFGLKPWRQDSFKVSPDPDVVEKVRDLVGLYMSPPVAARYSPSTKNPKSKRSIALARPFRIPVRWIRNDPLDQVRNRDERGLGRVSWRPGSVTGPDQFDGSGAELRRMRTRYQGLLPEVLPHQRRYR
jgi:hypothetical protein